MPRLDRCDGVNAFKERQTPDVVMVCGCPDAWKMNAARIPGSGIRRGRPVRFSAAAHSFAATSLAATARARLMRCSMVMGFAEVAFELTRPTESLGDR